MDSISQPTSNWPDVAFIDYTNWKGERSWRRISPRGIRFASTEFHPEPTWLLDAYDMDKEAMRAFALKDIHEWMDVDPTPPMPEPPSSRILKGKVVRRYERPTYTIED